MNADPVPRIRPSAIDTNTMPVIDARSHPGKEQIRGALRYNPKALLAADRLILPLPQDTGIAVYADDETRAEEIAQRLQAEGYSGAAVIEGGFEAYRDAGLPTEDLTEEQPVPGDERAGIPRL